jgi:hypothetical protein
MSWKRNNIHDALKKAEAAKVEPAHG